MQPARCRGRRRTSWSTNERIVGKQACIHETARKSNFVVSIDFPHPSSIQCNEGSYPRIDYWLPPGTGSICLSQTRHIRPHTKLKGIIQLPYLDKIPPFGITRSQRSKSLVLNLALVSVRHRDIVLGQAGFTRPILQQKPPNHSCVQAHVTSDHLATWVPGNRTGQGSFREYLRWINNNQYSMMYQR